MHQRRTLRPFVAIKKPFVIAALVAFALALPAAVYASTASSGNSNPLCYLVPRGSIEWEVMLCNLTEIPGGGEGG